MGRIITRGMGIKIRGKTICEVNVSGIFCRRQKTLHCILYLKQHLSLELRILQREFIASNAVGDGGAFNIVQHGELLSRIRCILADFNSRLCTHAGLSFHGYTWVIPPRSMCPDSELSSDYTSLSLSLSLITYTVVGIVPVRENHLRYTVKTNKEPI